LLLLYDLIYGLCNRAFALWLLAHEDVFGIANMHQQESGQCPYMSTSCCFSA
jgi:hypothetical protein